MRISIAASIIGLLVVGSITGYETAATLDNPVAVAAPQVTHTVSASLKELVEKTSGSADSAVRYQGVRGAIVNHHLLANQYIADTLAAIQPDSITRIILLSPNHFNRGDGPLLASTATWETPFGNVKPDADFVRTLTKTTALAVDERPFEEEHGISNIVPFLRKFLPESRVVPIIVKNNLQRTDEDTFVASLQGALGDNDLILVSIDFSHTFPLSVANAHDETSMAAIRSLRIDEVKNLDVDSRPSLRILLRTMKSAGANQFRLIHHGNSATIVGNPDLADTTSYITGVFTQ